MIIENNDGTFTGGPLDVWCILHDETTGRYHAAFFEEKPFPGPVEPVEKVGLVRLKSKMHHTEGAATLAEALVHLEESAAKLRVPEGNVWREPQAWNGEVGLVWLFPNWTKGEGHERIPASISIGGQP